MILRTVRLENFGLYAGTTEFDLVPRQRGGAPAPIVLVGGRNGAGKTTLLEAVRLALYGKRALGSRVGQSDYEKHLADRISRGVQSSSAAVTLEFDYAEAGTVHRYRVRREWSTRSKAVVETLALEKDGSSVTSVPRDEWNYFLQELIPPGVSQLFFFDGEKISEIAEGENDSEQLGEAIRGLLGIELVSRLRVDLGLFLARHRRDDDASLSQRIEAVIRDITVSERTVEERAGELAELISERDSQARAAERIRRQFVAEGGDAAAQRAKTEAHRDSVRRSIARIEHELRDLSNGLLPLALAPKLTARFAVALRSASKSGAANEDLKLLLARWRASGTPERRADWGEAHWQDLEALLASASGGRSGVESPALREVGDGAAALARIEELGSVVVPRTAALASELEDLTETLRSLDASLLRADGAGVDVLLDELGESERRLGATEARVQTLQNELQRLRGQIVTLRREWSRLEQEQNLAVKASEKVALAARTATALAEYENRLLDRKLQQLRSEFVTRFNHLARKDGLVTDILIDPVTFETKLVDASAREMPKASLSAGEKQIYAIAMLWALAATSGRPLPMIIDTPLARLDTEHRTNLVERYFPKASHQVILLSTDTEIDGALREQLKGDISHSYHLQYDRKSVRTVASPGYFDDLEGNTGGFVALQQA